MLLLVALRMIVGGVARPWPIAPLLTMDVPVLALTLTRSGTTTTVALLLAYSGR